MGKEKGGFLTPKQISNRIKAKGLQKLRWFCQMCQKQCRDENGFKCHTMSESHQRQLLLVADNPDKYIDEFSEQFCDDFLECLQLKCGTKRIQANNVYQDYIANRTHTHMNSTQWETLTDFVKWLGREGKCVVDETEKGWFIQLIDRKPDSIERQVAQQKKSKLEQDDVERNQKLLQQQIERASRTATDRPEAVFTDLQRQSEDEKVAFKLSGGGGGKQKDGGLSASCISINDKQKTDKARPEQDKAAASQTKKRKATALEEIIESEEKQKKKRLDYWLHEGIVVKVVTKKLGEKFLNKKGIVKKVIDRFAAKIELLDSGDRLTADQEQLQTVLPALGKKVLIINGSYNGETASLVSIDEKNFCCSITLQSGPLKGKHLDGIRYEDISKLN